MAGIGSVSSYNIAPGESADAAAVKRKIALALMQQGADTEKPIQHWTQGLAKLAQGALGGYQLYQADQADQEDRARTREIVGELFGQGPAAAETGAPVAAAAPATGGNPASAIASIESGGKYDLLGPVTRTGDRAYGKFQVMGSNVGPWTKEILGQEMTPEEFLRNPEAQEAVFSGKFGQYAQKYGQEGAARAWFAGEGGMNDLGRKDQLGTTVGGYSRKFVQALGTPPQGPVTAFAGQPQPPAQPAAPPAAAPEPAPAEAPRGGMTSNRRMQLIQSLATTRSGAPFAQAIMAKELEREGSRVRPLSEAEKKIYPGAVAVEASGKPIFPPAQTQVNLSTVANPVLEGVGKQIVEQRKSANVAAAETIPAIHDARAALDEGAITGAFADPRVFAQKVGALLGLDPAKAANTEVLRAALGNQVLGSIKSLGANPSNADRDYIEKVMGGQIALEEGSMRRILDIQEKYARQSIKNFNRDATKLMSADQSAYKGIAPLMSIEEPAVYAAPKRPAAAPAAPAAQPAAPAAKGAPGADGWIDMGNGVRIREKR